MARTAASLVETEVASRAYARLGTVAVVWPTADWLAGGEASAAVVLFRQAAADKAEAFELARLRVAAGRCPRPWDEAARARNAFMRMGALAAAERAQAAARSGGMRLGAPAPDR